MAFNAVWNGFGFNRGGIGIDGDTNRYRVRWGDGAENVVRIGDDVAHSWGQDGTYDVSVTQVGVGIPPVRLKAFVYSSATNDLSIGGTFLSDLILGGSGSDEFRGAGGDDAIAGAGGNDRLYGQGGNDFVLGGEGDDYVSGGDGNDFVGGNEGDDEVHGGAGGDTVIGDDGNDRLFGEDGDDRLEGGAGFDRLTGGAGADEFTFVATRDPESGAIRADPNRDLITDFQQGSDHLAVGNWFADGFTFIGAAKFSGAGGEVRFGNVNGGTIVFGDVDGDKVADFSFRIDGTLTLTDGDFFH